MKKPEKYACKELSREFDGETETVKFKILAVPEIKEIESWVAEACDYWQDPEDLYYKGIMTDYENDVYCIEVEKLLDAIEELTEEWQKQDDGDLTWNFAEKLQKLLIKYKDYTIYF